MKKLFFLAVAAVAVLAACTKNNVDNTSNKARQINFSTVAGMNTKAPITGTIYKTTDPQFGMFCYALVDGKNWTANSADGQLYMDNETISYNSTDKIWETSSVYYWPLSGSLTFIGYSPKNAAGTVAYNKSTKALTVTDFEVNSAAASQQDLMWATTQKDLTDNQSTYTSEIETSTKTGVNVIFHHALSQVKFNVKKAAGLDDYTITVNSITFSAYNKGTLTVTNDVPVWSAQALITGGSAFTYDTTGSDVVAPNNASAFAAFGVANMPVPQALVADTQKFTITYSLEKSSVNLGSKTVTTDLRVADGVTEWAQNTIYNYNIVIDLNKIYFNPTIVEWTSPEANQQIDVQ